MFEKADFDLLKKIENGAVVSEQDEKRLEIYRMLGYVKTGMTFITEQEYVDAINFITKYKRMSLWQRIKFAFGGYKLYCRKDK